MTEGGILRLRRTWKLAIHYLRNLGKPVWANRLFGNFQVELDFISTKLER